MMLLQDKRERERANEKGQIHRFRYDSLNLANGKQKAEGIVISREWDEEEHKGAISIHIRR